MATNNGDGARERLTATGATPSVSARIHTAKHCLRHLLQVRQIISVIDGVFCAASSSEWNRRVERPATRGLTTATTGLTVTPANKASIGSRVSDVYCATADCCTERHALSPCCCLWLCLILNEIF